MERYVLGFLFSEDEKWVALIQKLKPEWQKGLLNGIGGKVEPGESPLTSMEREFEEETGVTGINWSPILSMGKKDWIVEVFAAKSDKMFSVATQEEEIVQLHLAKFLPSNVIPNLHWLLPLCLDQLKEGYTLNRRKRRVNDFTLAEDLLKTKYE